MPNPLIAAAGIGGGASLLGAKKAADAQKDSTDAAVGLQREVYYDSRGRLQPYEESGDTALQQYMSELGLGEAPAVGSKGQTLEARKTDDGAFEVVGPRGHVFDTFENRRGANRYLDSRRSGGYEASPMARYLLEEGVGDITASMAKRGMMHSGSALKAVEDYRQNVITKDRDNYMRKLAGLIDSGQNAAAQQGSAGQAYAANAGNAMMAGGQAQAQGITNATNAITGTIGDMAGIYGYMNPQMNPMGQFSGQSPMTQSSFGRTPSSVINSGGLY